MTIEALMLVGVGVVGELDPHAIAAVNDINANVIFTKDMLCSFLQF